MQKNKVFVVAVFLLLCNTLLNAQKQTIPQIRDLEKISNDQRIIETQRYEKAMSLAAKKGWRLTIADDKGNVAQLVGVDESGFPMYVGTQSNVIAASTIGTNKLWTGGSAFHETCLSRRDDRCAIYSERKSGSRKTKRR
jgi:hypothetical protein